MQPQHPQQTSKSHFPEPSPDASPVFDFIGAGNSGHGTTNKLPLGNGGLENNKFIMKVIIKSFSSTYNPFISETITLFFLESILSSICFKNERK